MSDGTERVFYHDMSNGKITLERPTEFGDDNPTWVDGEQGHVGARKITAAGNM